MNYCLLSILVILVSLISRSFYLQQIFGKGNQAEASTQQKEKSVKAKAATEVFRKNFPKLLETVEPPKLAAVLFAEKIISDAVLKEFCNSTSNNQGGQTLKLLHDVLSVIETDPEYFGQVCTALEKDYASNAEKLRGNIPGSCILGNCNPCITIYLPADEFKSYLEELTKDKANGEHETPMLRKEQAQFKFLLL